MDANEATAATKLLHAFARFRLHGRPRHSPVAGLTGSELIVLSCLPKTDAEAGPRISEIGNLLGVAGPTITQQINELELHRFVEKHVDEEDRRAVRVRLTTKGVEALRLHHQALLATFEGLVAYLGPEQSNQLIELMTKVYTYFEEVRGGTNASTGNKR